MTNTQFRREHEQQFTQKDCIADHAVKSVAADGWKRGTAEATSSHSGSSSRDAQNAASSEKMSALGFPKTDITADPKNLMVKARYDSQGNHTEADEKIHHQNNDTSQQDVKQHLKSAGHLVKSHHGGKDNSTETHIGAGSSKPPDIKVVEKFTGNDGKLHTYTAQHLLKYLSNSGEGNQVNKPYDAQKS